MVLLCWISNVKSPECCFSSYLNSSPIDEHGEHAYEMGWWCQAKCKPRAGCIGIHGNPESSNNHQALSHWETQWRYLSTSILTYSPRSAKREGRGGEGANYCSNARFTRTRNCTTSQSEYVSSEAQRKSTCQIGVHDPVSTTDLSIGLISTWSAYETKFFISLFERGFKMMKNGIYFIVIALLVAELLKILIYAN